MSPRTVEGSTPSVTCAECGREFKEITSGHLTWTHHGMTVEQYRLKHPDLPLMSRATLQARQKAAQELFTDPQRARRRQEGMEIAHQVLQRGDEGSRLWMRTAAKSARQQELKEAVNLVHQANLMTIAEVSKLTGIPKPTLYSAIDREVIPSQKFPVRRGLAIIGIDPEAVTRAIDQRLMKKR